MSRCSKIIKENKLSDQTLKFSDDTIASIAKLVQIAILTGTDIVDNMRLIEFTAQDGLLHPTEEFTNRLDSNVSEMLEFAKENTVDEQDS